MPIYTYRCNRCEAEFDYRTSVGFRDTARLCQSCDEGLALRVFTPTALITIPAHFGVNQRDLLPAADDTAAWESRGGDSQHHAQQKDWQSDYEAFVKRDLAEQGMRL